MDALAFSTYRPDPAAPSESPPRAPLAAVPTDPPSLSSEQLADLITTWAGRLAAGEAELLRLLGEFDAREAWAELGMLSCAHWVAWRLRMTLSTAKAKVRVARALCALPMLASEFGAGRLSYAQVRAITRAATATDQHTWIELARHTTAAQLEKAVRGVARVQRNREREEHPELVAEREQHRAVWDQDGNLRLTFILTPTQAPAVLAMLEATQSAEQSDRDKLYAGLAAQLATGVPAETPGDYVAATEPYEYVEPPYPVLRQRVGLLEERTPAELAALKEWTAERDRRRGLRDAYRTQQEEVQAQARAARLPARKASLTDGFVRALTNTGGHPVTVQLLVDPLSGWARTSGDEMLPPTTLAAIFKSLPGRGLPRIRPVTAADLTRHDLGRTTRLVSSPLRRLLGQLDGERCRHPGCTRTRNLHAHHVRFWRNGGSTDLANLVLVCARHHTLVHRDGIQLVLADDRALSVTTAGGTEVPHLPALPWAEAKDLDADITATTLPTDWAGDRLDLDHVVWVLAQHAA